MEQSQPELRDLSADGAVACQASLEEGEQEIRLQVIDPEGERSSQPPPSRSYPPKHLGILSPTIDGGYYSDQLILYCSAPRMKKMLLSAFPSPPLDGWNGQQYLNLSTASIMVGNTAGNHNTNSIAITPDSCEIDTRLHH